MTTATFAEQIAAAEAKRAANVSAMENIMAKAADDQATLDAAGQEEFDELQGEIETLDDHIKRLKSMEAISASKAKPVEADTEAKASESRGVQMAVPARAKSNDPKGIEFARIAKVKTLSRLDGVPVKEVAKSYYGENSPTFEFFAKAAVPAANTGDPAWAGNLITDGGAFGDFVEYLRPRTILGQFGTGDIPALRSVPFDTPFMVQTSGGDGYWVGEGKAKPLTKFDTSTQILRPAKAANIAVATEEMLRRSSISADTWIRDELANALRARLDTDFVDPDKAAVAGVSPASITNGLTLGTNLILSGGNTVDDIKADKRALSKAFRAANDTTAGTVWIMSESDAEALADLDNPLGQSEFGGLNASGGTFMGRPVITSEYMTSAYEADPAGNAGVTGSLVVLVKASDIYFADEGGVMVDMSREASLEMDNAPTGDSVSGSGANLVSMWQTNSVAFRAERILNWQKRQAHAVAALGNVQWSA